MISGDAPTLEECSELVDSQHPGIDSKLFSLVYDYWKLRRFQENSGKSVQPILRVSFFLLERIIHMKYD